MHRPLEPQKLFLQRQEHTFWRLDISCTPIYFSGDGQYRSTIVIFTISLNINSIIVHKISV